MSKIKFNSLFWLLVIVLVFIPCRYGKKQQGKSLIIEIEDFKELKKIIRTKTNLLLIFSKTEKSVNNVRSLFEEVAVEMKGKATLALVDCSESKKICKNMKVSPSPLELKHYKDGNFNKDYDRKMVKRSMVNFLLDPTGDIPWEEETTAADVIHIDSATAFYKFLKKEKLPVLVMFYAPWCGFCKRLKPDFAAAATEVKGTAVLVGVDVDKPHQMKLREDFNITGFPTIYYFENGKKVFQYGGENNKDGIISWLKDPKAPEEKKPEPEWADEETDVVHLKDDTFDDYIQQNPSVMVMFYAPWCGHCKAMKPDYAKVASRLKEENIEGILAAVDATKEKKIGQRFEIKGFPSVKYFKNGEFAWDFSERTEEKIYEHMKDPSEPPPPPAPEPKWEETESEVVHLTDENFKGTLKKRKHALVMFYAPWCGHCKKAKPEYMQAAEKFKDDSKVVFAAIDCTSQQTVCTSHEVTGYPTFKYFKYGKNPQNYMGGREEADFINFMKDPQNPRAEPTPPPPETPEKQWAEVTGAENVHLLGAKNFDDFMKQHKSVLVMFYAPWCGHCKAMKPAYGEAAQLLKEQGERGVLAAIDATQESALASKFSIKGYPTLKYFKNGEEAFEYSKGRKTEDLVDFMKNPVAPPPTPEEPAWSDEPSSVLHLSASNFEAALKERSVGLVMFYAPWCGHCKNAKPSFTKAAATISKMGPKNVLAAVDCTKNKDLCSKEEVKGFPTFKLYINGVFLSNYDGGREEKDFVSFVENAPSVKDEL